MIGKSLLDEVIADPDNLGVRQVYADWLEQQGDAPRAELIRLQCGAAALPRGPVRSALDKQVKALIKDNPAWIAPVKNIKLAKKPVFRHGFLHQVTLPAYRFVEVADELFAAAPMLRSVIFPLPLDEIDALLKCPQVARLTSADLSQMCHCNWCAIDQQILAVFGHPSMANLTHLRAAGNRIDEDGARVIANATGLPHLRELDLSHNKLGNTGAHLLLEAPWLDQLTRLDLRENDLGVRVRAALRKRFGRVVKL